MNHMIEGGGWYAGLKSKQTSSTYFYRVVAWVRDEAGVMDAMIPLTAYPGKLVKAATVSTFQGYEYYGVRAETVFEV